MASLTRASLVLSAIGALLSCGGRGDAPSAEQGAPSPLSRALGEREGVYRAAPALSEPIAPSSPQLALTLEGFSSCDHALLKRLAAVAPRARLSVLLNAKELTASRALPEPQLSALSAYVRDLEAGGHSVSLSLNNEGNTEASAEAWSALSDEHLFAHRDALQRALHALGWRRPRPLPLLWRPPNAWLTGDPPHSSSSLFSAGEWVASSWARRLTIHPFTTEPKRGEVVDLLPTQRCALAQATDAQLKGVLALNKTKSGEHIKPLEVLLEPALRAREHPRLILSERPPISEGCATLFKLPHPSHNSPHTSSSAPRSSAPRWSLVLTREVTHEEGHEGAHEGAHVSYLTLDLPHQGPLPPQLGEGGALDELWARRALWWGAPQCVRRVEEREALPPVASLKRLDIRSIASKELTAPQRVHGLSLSAPSGVAHLPSHHELLNREESRELPLELRGLLAEQADEQSYVSALESLSGPLALYDHTGALRGVTLLSARPLVPYLTLAALTAQEAFTSLSFEGLTFAGPLLITPSELGWRASLSWQAPGLEGSTNATLSVARLKSSTPPLTSATSPSELLGQLWSAKELTQSAESLTHLKDIEGVYGRRGGLKRALSLSSDERLIFTSGALWWVESSRLGSQRVRLIAPPGERGPRRGAEGW